MYTQVRGRKKLLFMMMALAMVFCLAACGSGGDDSAAGETAEEVLQKAQENMANASSMSTSIDIAMGMTVAEQTIDFTTTGQVDYVMEPMVMKMDLTMDMGDLGAMDMLMYAQQEGDSYVSYMQMAGDPTWYKQELADMESFAQYDTRANMNLYLDSSSNFEEIGTETINGVEAVRYDGVIGKDALGEVMATSGAFEQLGLDEASLESLLTDLGEMPISFWVDKANYQMVRYSMDMSQVMQTLMANLMESQGAADSMTIDKMAISMNVNSVNEISSIELPAETQNAVPMEAQE